MRSKLVWIVLLLACLIPGVAHATIAVMSSASVQPDTTWLYQYEISNINDGLTSGSVYDFKISLGVEPLEVYTPDLDGDSQTVEWTFFVGGGVQPFVEWTAEFGSELAPGGRLAGFGLLSDMAPALWPAEVITTADEDPYYMVFDREVLAPESVIPEPATLTLFGLAAASALGLARRKRA